MLTRKLNQLINGFIPQSFLEQTLSNDLMRARVLVIMLLWSIPNTLLVMVLVLVSDSYDSVNKTQAAMVILSITIAYSLNLYFFKYWGLLTSAANVFVFSAFIGIAVPGLFTGGMDTAVTTPLILAVPVLAYLTSGRRWGMFWALICGLTVAFYYIADQVGVIFPRYIDENARVVTYFLVCEMALLIISVCLFIYESQLEALTGKLEAQTERFAYDAQHDQLTGLCNRSLFETHANKAIQFALSENLKAAIIYIDLDDFKPVNDTYGHHVGDEVLKIVAQRLRQAVRSSDSVARLGGDEFAVLLHGANGRASICIIAEKMLVSLRSPMDVSGLSVEIGASMGVITIPDDGSRLDQVLKLADAAMYKAKQNKNQVSYYRAADVS